jgi:hypothetical protein
MATTDRRGSSNLDKLSWYLKHGPHAVWDAFPRDEQDRMVADDLTAGKTVSLLLFLLISTGLVLSAVTLLAILLTS